MKNLLSLAAFVGLAFGAAGCAISPGPEVTEDRLCDIPRYHLAVEVAEDPNKASLVAGPSFADALREDYADVSAAKRTQPHSPSMLFISGGSQHGAFGAGFLHGWAEKNGGHLPRFKVVTGVSTGAILSTFAFLDETEVPVAKYSIQRESEVLNRIGGKSLSGGIKIARTGAMGDLAPLRQQLRGLMTDRMERVAAEAAAGRSLYVAAVDFDTAGAVVFDLTKLATRYAGTADPDARTYIRDCYVEAIMASSIVPAAALPVFMDNRMYIDGGARFGVISDEIGAVIEEKSKALQQEYEVEADKEGFLPANLPEKPKIYVIINGTLSVEEQCSKADSKRCPDSNANWQGAHKDWDLLGLATRSLSMLINQGYRFSSARILDRAEERGFEPHLVRIGADAAGHESDLKDPVLGTGRASCATWKFEDEIKDKPLEFHPRYMRCMIDYGMNHKATAVWAEAE